MGAQRYMRWPRHLVVGILIACATVAGTASAASASGEYTAVVSPGSVAPGASTAFTVTLTNISNANPLNVAIVQPPRGFVVTAVSRPSASGNSKLSNGQVVLKGLSLHAGESESIEVTATPTTPGSCGQSSWSVQAFKSSLQGRQLMLDGADSSLTTTVNCGRTVSTDCPAGHPCSSTLSTPYTSATVAVSSGRSDSRLTESVDVGTPQNSNSGCSGYTPQSPDWYGFNVNAADRSKVITWTVKNSNPATFKVCFGAPYPFETLGDQTALPGKLPDLTPGFVGLLERCESFSESPEACVQSIARSGNDTIATVRIDAGLSGDPFVGR
jgi:hypothetical protein